MEIKQQILEIEKIAEKYFGEKYSGELEEIKLTIDWIDLLYFAHFCLTSDTAKKCVTSV